MSVDAALAFLKKVEDDLDFRGKVLSTSENNGLVHEPREEQELKRAALIKEYGFEFSKDELYEAAGIPPIDFDHETELKLRALDEQLRSKGLQGINPLAFTAYTAGIN